MFSRLGKNQEIRKIAQGGTKAREDKSKEGAEHHFMIQKIEP